MINEYSAAQTADTYGVTEPDYCVLKFKCKTADYYYDFRTVSLDL